jgi:hypothetical protein
MFGLSRLNAWSSDPTDFVRSMISIILSHLIHQSSTPQQLQSLWDHLNG